MSMETPEQIAERIANQNWRYDGLVPLRNSIADAIRAERDKEVRLTELSEIDLRACQHATNLAEKAERELAEAGLVIGEFWSALPNRREWLDPVIEARAKDWISRRQQSNNLKRERCFMGQSN